MWNLSEIEFVRLEKLRDRYQERAWSPELDGLSLSERLGISLATIPLGIGHGGVVRYRCVLSRSTAEGAREFEAFFQVMPVYPSPPDAAELLSWLAGTVANCELSSDLSGWCLLQGITAQGRVHTLPYRGLFHEEAEIGDFIITQHRKASELRDFLGPTGFLELMQEVAHAK